MQYYVFINKFEADACLNAINTSGWFPVVGKVAGVAAPQNKKTTKWADESKELLSGEWCVPRVPKARLDFIGVPEVDQQAFLNVYGGDTRELSRSDFPAEVEI